MTSAQNAENLSIEVWRWLGRRWVEGDYECADFARELLAEAFGLTAPWGRPAATLRARDRQFEEVVGSGAVQRVPSPVDGDLVLMRDTRGRRLNGWHVGVWIDRAVLHLPADGLSVHEPVHRLLEAGWTLEGWYRCPR